MSEGAHSSRIRATLSIFSTVATNISTGVLLFFCFLHVVLVKK